MPENLSPETAEKIRAFYSHISVKGRYSPEGLPPLPIARP
jgi:hypothetical protein